MSWPLQQLARALPPINEEDDSRVGSAQDNSTGGTLSKIDLGGDSSSLVSLVSTLVPVIVYAVVCVVVFWCLRRRLSRVYRPRTILSSLLPQERSNPLPDTWFNWVKPFFQIDDTAVLHHSTLDAYLFLRYLKVLVTIAFAGVCLTWPILLPIHSKGGGDKTQLDSLTMGNVTKPNMYFAHVVIAYVYFGFIMFYIYRECIFYINLRHAYLMSPYQSKRLSSRTVLFLCVPQRYLDERRLRKVFGDGVKNVWIPKDTEDLEKLVKERDQTARRLERAEIRLIKMANRRRKKQLEAAASSSAASGSAASLRSSSSTNHSSDDLEAAATPLSPAIDVNSQKAAASTATTEEDDPEFPAPPTLPPGFPDVNGSVAAQWIRARERPHHRPIANYLRRVDTIKWTRNRIKVLSPRVKKEKRALLSGKGKAMSAAFVEFTTQAEAERAYQTQAHHRPNHMSPRFIGVRPDEVIWDALGMGPAVRIVRRFAVFALVTVAIIFWSFPSAFVGAMSNISYLAETLPFLAWIMKLPDALTGILQGILPAIALSLLMAIVPWLLRGCARMAGAPSLSLIELFVQNAYFPFQVVQVFIVTTLSSAASGALTAVLQDPLSAKDLLSENLPKSSNFYISYILVQCLAVGAGGLVHVVDIVRHYVIAKRVGSPRAMFNIWHRVRVVHWGGIFPVFTNMGVIAISYSCIAPLILGFATAGLSAIYLVYRYNLLYIYNTSIDTRGLVYPRALLQLLVGLYLAEVCLIGLFALRSAFAPMLLMILFFVFSVLMSISISGSISPLLYNLPQTLSLESDELAGGSRFEIGRDDAIVGEGSASPSSSAAASWGQDELDFDEVEVGKADGDDDDHVTTGTRALGVEGADGFASSVGDVAKNALRARVQVYADALGLGVLRAWVGHWLDPPRVPDPGPVMRFLHPGTFEDFAALQRMLPPGAHDDPTGGYPADYARRAYWPPVMTTPMERLWVPRDEAGVSRQEVRHSGEVIGISDEGAWLEGDGGVRVDVERAPYFVAKVLY